MSRAVLRGMRTGLLLALLVPPVALIASFIFWVIVLSVSGAPR
jgi:hypothetical protein